MDLVISSKVLPMVDRDHHQHHPIKRQSRPPKTYPHILPPKPIFTAGAFPGPRGASPLIT